MHSLEIGIVERYSVIEGYVKTGRGPPTGKLGLKTRQESIELEIRDSVQHILRHDGLLVLAQRVVICP
jgi:hypothetical protein